jgi:alpha-tubulin suppressor-like RCC1 family protein
MAHVRDSIFGLYAGPWSGTYGSGTSTLGTWALSIAADGTMSGTFVDAADGPGTLTGTLRTNGTFALAASSGDAMTGTVDPAAGTFSGTLAKPGGTGWFHGTRGGPAGQVATPSFSPAPGGFGTAQSVTIATTTPGATIRYTADGTAPSETVGTVYASPVAVATTTTLKAVAYRTGWTSSAIATGTWTIAVASVVAAPTFSPPPGSYTAAQSVAIASATSGATIRYTVDGTAPSGVVGTVYSGPVAIAASTTLKAIAYRSGWTTSSVTAGDYTITTGGGGTAPAVVAGVGFFTLASRGDGILKAWGSNSTHQLGDGTNTGRTSPVQATITGVARFGGGGVETIVAKADGTAWTSLGQGWTWVQVAGMSQVVGVACGNSHNLVLKGDGTVWGWGLNVMGAVGDGTTTYRPSPVQATGISGVVAISAAPNSSYAVRSDGTVWAWGQNDVGQLGDGTRLGRTSAVQVGGMAGATAVAGGTSFAIALKSDGTVWAWGMNNAGQLGNGTSTGDSLSAVQVPGLGGIVAVAAGYAHGLALRGDGRVFAWGANNLGQLGLGTTANATSPTLVPGLSGVRSISASTWNSVAGKDDGTVWTWGYNNQGQIGDGTTTNRSSPVEVVGF